MTVLEGHLRCPCVVAGLHGLHDFVRLGRADGQRLVTIDVLSGPDGGDHHVLVKLVGRAAVDDVDILIRDQRRHAVIDLLIAAGRLRFLGRLGRNGVYPCQPDAAGRRIVVDRNRQVSQAVHPPQRYFQRETD